MASEFSPRKKRQKKEKKSIVPIEGRLFVPLTFEEQDSPAFIELGGNASKVYGYLKRAARTAACKGGTRERDIIFGFSYAEAKGRGFSESTFIRAIKELWGKGFIDVIERGGLRGKGKTLSQYKLAGYWKTYGKEWRNRTDAQADPFAPPPEPKDGGPRKW